MERNVAARLRLANQRLIGRPFADILETVRHLGAVQAQDYPGATWGLAQRTIPSVGGVDGAVDTLIADGAVIRTHVLRPTWHLVAREDLRDLLSLSAARILRSDERRLRELNLDRRTVTRAVKAIARELAGGTTRSRPQLAEVLREAGIDPDGQRMPHILMAAELEGVICSGPRVGKQHGYALLDERVPARKGSFDRERALSRLVTRYLRSHGPISIRDLAWWSGQTGADVRAAIDPEVFEAVVVEGEELFVARGTVRPRSQPAVRLLANYDEFLGSSHSRAPSMERLPGVSTMHPVLGRHVLVIDGQIVGGWKPRRTSQGIGMHVQALTRLSTQDRREIEVQSARYARFFGAQPQDVTIARA